MDGQWILSADGRTIYVELADGGKSVIATVENERACREMLRYAKAGEEMEGIMDRLMGDTVLVDLIKCPQEQLIENIE
jgi:hypothetical protein